MKTKSTFLALALFGVLSVGTTHAAPMLHTLGDYSYAANHAITNAYLEIDVQAFEDNITNLRQTLGEETKICAVLKGDAYGHGIDLLMPSVIKLGVSCIAVTSNEEARVARAHGYQGIINRVRIASGDEVESALAYDITELVGSLDHAKTLDNIAKKHGKVINFHLALNAGGMGRNGLDVSNKTGQKDAIAITKLSNLNMTGIMTHYAFEDETFVRESLAQFNKQTDWLIKAAKLDRKKLTLHTANSFATALVPESRLDMVRPGRLMYGDPVGGVELPSKRIMQFKSKVAAVHFYPKGTKIGYDGTYELTRDSYLANLPLGFSDGYRRIFSNKGHVLINGHRAPVVGKTSMNTTMVDVTDIMAKQPVKINDEVVLFGKQGDSEVTQAEIEELNDALLADLYSVWGNSNPRLIKP